ncbi:four helix bundle protein [Lacibacter sp.]|uniref:four helix bundle protein n=1 Tax=Lacibacter sp. TaxID=1915409 RepID=UPI002B4AD343|nr:four helix bundle protein [Lacibacter sp.]HLP38440.1 four helix bundle protein [Lacibacter sp.]
MDKNELKKRSKQLAVNTGWLCLKLPFNAVNKEYVSQVVRSSSSGGANYRAACRAKSKPDFINKLRIVEEELDESMYFFELLAEFNPTFKEELRDLYKEANELLSIVITSINTSLKNMEIEKQTEKSVRKNLKS